MSELDTFEFEEDLENWPDGVEGEVPDFLPKSGEVVLTNGCHLYWKPNEVGGRTYYSDEIGPGVEVWDTALVDASTLITAIDVENKLRYFERISIEQRRHGKS